MKTVLKVISFSALAGVLAVAIGFFADGLSLERAQTAMLLCTAAWFATAPFWMEHKAAD